jgi:hypothetical protein
MKIDERFYSWKRERKLDSRRDATFKIDVASKMDLRIPGGVLCQQQCGAGTASRTIGMHLQLEYPT